MIKVRVIDKEGKDEIHTVLKFTWVGNKCWFYGEGFQYCILASDIMFFQSWSEEEAK